MTRAFHELAEPVLPLQPTELLSGYALEDAVAQSVHNVRTELFGSPKVPFPKWRDAADWISNEQQVTRGARERLRRILADPQPGQSWERSHKLGVLREAARRISKATGCPADRLVKYVLAGGKLTYPRATIGHGGSSDPSNTLPDGSFYPHHYVTLRIWSPEITDDEWRKIARAVRAEFGRKRSKPVSEKALAVYRAARSIKGDPELFSAKDWERVQTIVYRRGYKPAYGSWRGVKLMYARTKKKLDSLGVDSR